MSKRIHAVCGSPRSCTSIMMRAIIAGSSLVPVYTPGRGRSLEKQFDRDGYQFNHGEEIYELMPCGQGDPDDEGHREVDPDSCSGYWMRSIAALGRPPTIEEFSTPEILASILGEQRAISLCGEPTCYWTFRADPERFAGSLIKVILAAQPALPRWMLPEVEHGYRAVFLVRDFLEVDHSASAAHTRTGKSIQIPTNRAAFNNMIYGTMTDALRRDVRVSVVVVENLMRDPLNEFQKLQMDGWPIDPNICASMIEPGKHRFRAEILDERAVLH